MLYSRFITFLTARSLVLDCDVHALLAGSPLEVAAAVVGDAVRTTNLIFGRHCSGIVGTFWARALCLARRGIQETLLIC